MQRRHLLSLGLALAVPAAGAQTYPDKSKVLKIVAPGSPGGSVDVLARALSRGIAEVSGWTAIVENKAGAEMVIGVQAAKAAAPDGYTMMLTTSSTQVLNLYMVRNLPYDPVADFVPLAGISKTGLMLVAGPNNAYATVAELLAAARAAPGQLSYASGTTTTRLAGEMLQQAAGINLLNVPYRAIAEAATGLAGGQVDILFADALTLAPLIQSGRARPLAVSTTTRMPAYPKVPTLAEAGVPEYDLTAWFATYVPTNTPAPVVAALEQIVRKATRTTVFTGTLERVAMDTLDIGGPELKTLQRVDAERVGKVVRAAGIQPP